MKNDEKIAVLGLGYVGLPVALAFARKYEHVVGYDIDLGKVEALLRGEDLAGQFSKDELQSSGLQVTNDASRLSEATFFIVTVPTPIDELNRPDLNPLKSASRLLGEHLSRGAVVVYESTVYPGVTQDICGPILAEVSGLKGGLDFKLAYSPERINPGDTEHVFEKIVKVVAAEDEESLKRVVDAYSSVVEAGVHKASDIRVAEAAKVIENTQRDLNVAFMNELALIFDRLGIPTREVLAAAGTKWNFLPFAPGLVGGHCIGVDPYYLTSVAEQSGYHPQVILSGRRINDGMGTFIAQKMIKLLVHAPLQVKGARVGMLGLTFKENVPDIRNSRVPDIVKELRDFGVEVVVCDPYADKDEVKREYGIDLVDWGNLSDLDGLVWAVGHDDFRRRSSRDILECLKPSGVFVDVKSLFDPSAIPQGMTYWSL